MTVSHTFGHGLVPMIFWGTGGCQGREDSGVLESLDPDGCMDGLERRDPDPTRSKILGALLKARPRLTNLLSATPQEPRQGQSLVTHRFRALSSEATARRTGY